MKSKTSFFMKIGGHFCNSEAPGLFTSAKQTRGGDSEHLKSSEIVKFDWKIINNY